MTVYVQIRRRRAWRCQHVFQEARHSRGLAVTSVQARKTNGFIHGTELGSGEFVTTEGSPRGEYSSFYSGRSIGSTMAVLG